MTKYKRYTIIDGKAKWVIVDENRNIINKNPSKEELKCLKAENYKKVYTDEELLNYLELFYDKYGEVPIKIDFDNNRDYPSSNIYHKRFGSWNNAIKMAGLRIRREYTDEELLDYLELFYEKYGEVPMKRDFDNNLDYPGSNIYHKRFGSWNKALLLAGLHIRGKYTDKELLDMLKRSYKENGKVPIQSDFVNNPEYPSFAYYRNRFGSWNEALLLAELDIDTHRKFYTDEELLNYLKEFYNKNGRPPTNVDFTNNSKYPNFNTYAYRFGSWNKALKLVEMDLDTRIRQGYCNNKIENGRSWEIMVGEMFDNKHIDLSGEYYKSTYDGICPNNQIYEAKSAELRIDGKWQGWSFATRNKDKGDDIEAIQWYYFGAFNKGRTQLIYVWRVPGDIVEGNRFIVGKYGGKFTVENMKEYDITDTFKELHDRYKTKEKLGQICIH